MPIVEMPDGRVIEFPDSMSETEINAALGEKPPISEPPRPDYSRFLAGESAQVGTANLRGLVNEQLPVLGMIGGGALGGLPGAGLGYAIGNYMIRPPATAEQGLKRIPGEVATGITMEMGGRVLGNLFAKYAVPTAQKFASTVRGYYEKAIRPPVGVQRTAAQADQYFGRVTDAVETIVGNRENLKLVDDTGNLVAGKLPTSVKEFSQAIDQTKRQVFSEYDALARQAGRQQVQIDLRPIAKDMMALRNDQVLQTMAPEALDYAGAAAQRLATQGSFSPSQAQEAIGIANQSLRAFYKNPTYETATKAWVDASVAQKLRTALDTAIESATGAEYQQLKNLYGSLRAIEEDVSKRAAVEARKNVKGFFSLPDIWGGAELARGFLTAEPGSAVAGATAKGLSKYYRWLNSPDRQVDAMFSKASSMMEVMGKTGQRVYSEPIDKSGIVPSPDYKMIEWEGTGKPAEVTPIKTGAPLPTTGLGMPDVNIGPPAWQAPQIVTRPQPTPPYAKTGQPLLAPEQEALQALRPGASQPDVTIPPRPPAIVQGPPGQAPLGSKVGSPLATPQNPVGMKAKIGRVEGEIRLSADGNTIEFVGLSEAESRLGLKPGWAYSGEPKPVSRGSLFHGTNEAGVTGIVERGFQEKQGLSRNLTESLEDAKSYGMGKVLRGQNYHVLERTADNVLIDHEYTYGGKQVASNVISSGGPSIGEIRNAFYSVQKSKGLSQIDHISIADIADQLGVSAEQIKPIIQKALASGEVAGSDMSWTLGSAKTPQRIKDATLNLRIGKISDIIFR